MPNGDFKLGRGGNFLAIQGQLGCKGLNKNSLPVSGAVTLLCAEPLRYDIDRCISVNVSQLGRKIVRTVMFICLVPEVRVFA